MKSYDWELNLESTIEYDRSPGTNRKITPISIEPNDSPDVEIKSIDVYMTVGSLKAALNNLTGHEKNGDLVKINIIDVVARQELETIKDNILEDHSEDAS
jgi:hypothetical protein